MRSNTSVFLSVLLAIVRVTTAASKFRACPLLGQQYPAPIQLSNNPIFQAATHQIENALKSNAKAYSLGETSLSIAMFNPSEDEVLYQYHHTNALLANSSHGARKVDANSIYRIASISKLLTMYMFLIEDGDRHFNDPIAVHVPSLRKASGTWNPITPEWDEITIGDLAGQMAGLAGDFGAGDLAPPRGAIGEVGPSVQAAFPHLPPKEVPHCGYLSPDGIYSTCSLDEYIQGITSESPIYPTAYTPVYSNEAFVLIGVALERITGRQSEAIFKSTIVDQLDLTGTSYTVPSITPKTAVIPGSPLEAGWSTEFGVFGPSGGYFSTTNDLAAIGKAILNSTLLPKAQTNRWLKPSSFVESFDQGVGRPWEIFRQKVNGQSIDIYSKSGGYGVYATTLILVPQYDFGFTILTASNPGTTAGFSIRDDFPNEILDVVVPVLDRIARAQAASNFAGIYVNTNTNSSLTISTNSQDSGLIVSQWSSNGVNLLKLLALVTPDIVLRLQPNQIEYGDKRIGFTSYYMSATPPTNSSIVYFKCDGWFSVDPLTFGNIPIGQMVFEMNGDGSAKSVELRALRTTLRRRPQT